MVGSGTRRVVRVVKIRCALYVLVKVEIFLLVPGHPGTTPSYAPGIGSPAWLYCRHESLEDYPSKRLHHLLWPPCKYES